MSSQPLLQLKDLLSADPDIIKFFSDYANISEEELISKAISIHNRAQLVHKYRCIETFRFLVPRIKYNSYYQDILKISISKSILDIGCGLGQDLRKLSLDGVPEANLYGLDIEAEFINLGYELFNDRSKSKIHFFITNILDKTQFDKLKSQTTFDIVYSSAVIHLLNKEDIEMLLSNIYQLLSENGIFFGQTTGLPSPQVIQDSSGRPRYLHSQNSLQRQFSFTGFKNIKINYEERSLLSENSSDARSSNRGIMYFYCEK